ncbi:DUF3105 domain-containing protein [Candidatus Gottesmanbacteria bacterium]|nr:DUF3105 domain-containing protein [Candidatus Gottesmanbacteria bacterium]
MQWWKIVLGIVGIIAVGWFLKYITTPLPGQSMPDQGREHVSAEKMAAFVYNSNPPTSGPHLETWVKPGVYTEPQKEGELVHSLEHGYVIIHYATASAELAPQLEEVARRKGLKKLIVVPRPQLDTKIALTAWIYIDKFNDFDAKRIEKFIDYHRDQGPEKTME